MRSSQDIQKTTETRITHREQHMADNEVAVLKTMLVSLINKIDLVENKVDNIGKSLVKCQQHCYIDNPPVGKWKVLFKSFLAIFKFR